MAIDDEIKLNLNAGNPLTGSQINVSAYGGTNFLEEYEETIEPVKKILKETPTPPQNLQYPINDEKKYYGASVTFTAREVKGASVNGLGVMEKFGDLIESMMPSLDYREANKALQEANSPDYNAEDNGGVSQEQAISNAKDKAKSVASTIAGESGGSESDTPIYSEKIISDRKGVPKIKLYLPVAFQQNDSFNIATPELGQIGAGAAAIMSKGGRVLDGLTKGASTFIDLVTGQLAGDAARLGSSQLAGKVPVVGTELGAATQISGAVTVNPNIRSAFRGVALREFSFTFKFIARSRKESDQVEKIIHHFRTYSYPESIEVGGISAGYKYPDMFSIVVKHEPSGKRVGTKIKDCFLRSIATNYNPTSMSFHTDGQPVEVDLTLNFVEEVTLSRKDVAPEDGY